MISSQKSLEIKLVELPELLMIGLPVNVSFKHGDFSKIKLTKENFEQRLSEIPNAVDPENYYSPWYSCKVMFTYFYCLQVNSLEEIPEGMMGFSVPAHKYVSVDYDGVHPFDPDPYEALHQHQEKHQMKVNKEAMIVEKYAFANDGIEGRLAVSIYSPIE